MTTELEAKWLDIDPEAIRELLGLIGGERIHAEQLMRRRNFDFPDKRLEKIGGWARVRDEGDRITMSYKQVKDQSLHGTQETELVIDSFEKGCQFLKDLGLEPYSYQE